MSTVSTIHEDFSLDINGLNEEQKAHFQNISTKISMPTPEAMREAMAELIPFLSDESDEVSIHFYSESFSKLIWPWLNLMLRT